jgi:phage shock protein PspC (stress-responsive transcriptional regulator)
MLAGVCDGLACWLGWKPLVVRVLFVVGSVIPILPGFLVYAVLWVVIPLKDAGPVPARRAP